MFKLTRLLPACLLLLLLPVIAHADNVIITNGSLTLGCPDCIGRASFRSIGFSFSGAGFSVRGQEIDGPPQRVLSNCVGVSCFGKSANIRLDSNADLGAVFVGSGTFNGATINPAFFNASALLFRGPLLTIPLLDTPTITITAPFYMTGNLSVATISTDGHVPVFSMTVQGSGMATLTLARFFDGLQYGYQLTQIRYDFQPSDVPEPTTLWLLGAGLAGLTAAVRRRRPR
jgi:PEP-CTERM motif